MMSGFVRLTVGVVLALSPVTALGQAQGSQPNTTVTNNQAANSLNLVTGRIAVINTSAFALPNGIAQLRQQIERVNETFKDRNAQLTALRQRVEALQQEVQTQQRNLTPQALAAKQEELEEISVEFQRKREDLERDYNKAMQDATDPVLERVETSLAEFAKQHGITIVLEAAVLAQARGLAYVDPGLDITQAFVEAYNAANPVNLSTPSGSRRP